MLPLDVAIVADSMTAPNRWAADSRISVLVPESSNGVDLNGDGLVNTQDFLAFLNLWSSGNLAADWNVDGTVNTIDFVAFLNDWVAAC